MRILATAGIAGGVLAAVAAPKFTTREPAALFAPAVVSTGASEVRIAFSPDGSSALWGTIGASGGPGGWEIFESRREGADWSAPRPAAFNSTANDFDPAFAPDGRGVYFFSNRPGGVGGDDIYFVSLDPRTGAYGAPANLGPGINTPKDEWAPVVSPDGATLMFATDGRGGKGRHDLFVAARSGDGWGPAKNLEAVNTAEEDFDAAFLPDGKSIVLTSGDFDRGVALYFASFADGRYAPRQKLPDLVNAGGAGAWTLGPAFSASEPGVLYFSAERPGGRGRSDIYRIPYALDR